MARKHSSESSDEDGGRHRGRSRKDAKPDARPSREGSTDSSDSDRRTTTRRHDRKDARMHEEDERARVVDRRSEKETGGDGEGRRRSENRQRREVKESSDEEGEFVEGDRGRHEKGELGERDGGRREEARSSERNGGRSPDEGRDKRERRDRDVTRRHDNGDRRRETEDDYRSRDRHSRRDLDDDRSKDEHRRAERHRDRVDDDRYNRHRDRDEKDDNGGDDRYNRHRDRDEKDDGDDRYGRRHRNRDEKDDGDDRYGRRHRNRDEKDDDGDDGGEKYRRDHERDSKREDYRREKDRGDEKTREESKPQRQAAVQDGDSKSSDALALGKSGGIYIPPFRLARMMKEVEDKSSPEYQRLTWDALRKSINGLVNKVNAANIKNIIPELFSENLIRGRGLFCRSCLKSQMASPGFTDVFAALVAVVNTKFPEVGELLLKRIILQLRRGLKRNDKPLLLAAVKFTAHLVNQQVVSELIALELLTVLLNNPTDDSVEVAVGFVTECGAILQDLTPKGITGAFERFRGILHEGEIDKRVQFLIEGLFAIRKAKFQGYPAVRPELDLVDLDDQLTHEISLNEENIDQETSLDIFKLDPNYLENERRYEQLKKTILGEDSEDEEGSDAGSDDEDEDGEDEDDDNQSDEEDDEESMQIKDETETDLINLRRTIYLTIMSSMDFEEAGHKLLKIKLEPGQEMELCIMLLECCSQERTYNRYYGLMGQRFCMINKVHQENFEKCFVQQYSMIHRLETNKLRNVAKFFAHLLGTDALPWHVLAYIRLTEEDTTSSSRIFIKILFQELSEHLGIRRLNDRLSDPVMQDSFESIFPRDNPKNTRFSINFFTSIGLGGITENLREYLKNMPRMIMQQQQPASDSEPGSEVDASSDSDSSSESSDSSESDSDSEESDSSSEEDRRKKRKKRNNSKDERDRKRSKRSRD